MAVRRGSGRPPEWSVSRSLDEMDKGGIAAAIVSLVQPGIWFGNAEEARRLARACNDEGAGLVSDHPDRFGVWGAIPLPDTEGSLREIEHALDTLKLDGIGLFTNYEGKYLGDPAFAPIYEELDRRRSVVFVHPISAAGSQGLVPGLGEGTIEWPTDTTRTIASLVFSGTSQRFPGIRWIFSHGGGTLPYLVGRFIEQGKRQKDPPLPGGPLPELQKFHYELAQGHTPGQLAALMKMVPTSQLLYGTDFPLRTAAEVNRGIAVQGFTANDLAAIEHDNARKLVPRLASRAAH
jgi:predicted TIM-barrel fold metal-dependent hydrolase